MKRLIAFSTAVILAFSGLAEAASKDEQTVVDQQGKTRICRMEQQCHWENFKKICTYVKVCR
jgi:hypothetical protein